jgi:hypothetical protein
MSRSERDALEDALKRWRELVRDRLYNRGVPDRVLNFIDRRMFQQHTLQLQGL